MSEVTLWRDDGTDDPPVIAVPKDEIAAFHLIGVFMAANAHKRKATFVITAEDGETLARVEVTR